MRVIAILACLFLAGCEEKLVNSTEVGAVSPLPVVAVATCEPFDLDWPRDVNLESPSVTFTAPADLSGYDIQAAPFASQPTRGLRNLDIRKGEKFKAAFRFEYDSLYRISGSVKGCWSTWQEFRVGPKNPDASGISEAGSLLHVAPLEWSRCEVAGPSGYIQSVTFTPPFSGLYSAEFTFKDYTHRVGDGNSGQVEVMQAKARDWVGFSPDIPDNRAEVEWFVGELSGPIHMERVSGSIKEICVTARQ